MSFKGSSYSGDVDSGKLLRGVPGAMAT